MNEKQAFSPEFYKQTRAGMTASLSRIESLFRFTLTIPVPVFSWVLTQGYGLDTQGQEVITCLKLPRELLKISWYIPPFITTVGIIIISSVFSHIIQIGIFLKNMR